MLLKELLSSCDLKIYKSLSRPTSNYIRQLGYLTLHTDTECGHMDTIVELALYSD